MKKLFLFALIFPLMFTSCENSGEMSDDELIEAIKSKNAKHIIHEAADLWFHSLVALSFNKVTSKDILNELSRRFGVSGLDEKKVRK